jgi:hypothetical protein
MSILKGTITSIGDEGSVTTPCTLDTDTGELSPGISESPDIGYLVRENFEGEDGSIHGVCPECHKYILIGNDFCTDPTCIPSMIKETL